MIVIDIDDVPKSCDVCPFMRTNDDLMSDDYRYMYCGFPYMGEFVSDYITCRHPNCPIKCNIEDIKAEIQVVRDMYEGCEYICDKARRDELWHVFEIIDKHIKGE